MRVTHFRDLRWPTEWDKWETLLWQQKPLLWNHQASVCCLMAVVALFKQPTSDIEEKKKRSGPQNTPDMRQEVAEGRIIMTPNSQLGWPLRVCSKLEIWSTWAGPSRLYTRHFSTLQLLSTGSETNQISTDWFYLQNQNVNWKSEHGHLKWMNSIIDSEWIQS